MLSVAPHPIKNCHLIQITQPTQPLLLKPRSQRSQVTAAVEMNSERSNKGKEKLIEDDDHCPSQNNLPGSDNQQKKFGVSRGATEAVVSTGGDLAVSTVSAAADGASCSHSASEKLRTELRPLSDFVDQINTCHLQWTEKLHNHFVSTTKKLGRLGKKVTPKALIEAMAITGLTTKHVKSRLQAFRKGRITETNWQAPRGPRRKNNKAGKIDGRKSASKSASTSSREHDPNGPGMGDQNVAVTAQHQPHHDFNQNKSPEQIQNHLELDERSRTVSAGHQQPSQVDVADISAANGYSIPGPYTNSAHWVQSAQAGGVGLQEPTSNGYSIPGPYNNSTSSTAINNVQDSQQEQNGVGLQIQTPGFRDCNGFFYPFQPGNHNHWVQFAQYCVGLQVQTPGFRHQNGVYNFEPGNELACVVQPTQYGVGVQEQTPGLQYQNEVYNFQPEKDFPRVVQPSEDGVPSRLYNQNEVYNIQAGNETHMVQQPAQDGGALGNIQQQNQPQAATDTVQAQNATAITPDNMVTTEDLVEDFLNLDSSELGIADFDFSEPFGFVGLPL